MIHRKTSLDRKAQTTSTVRALVTVDQTDTSRDWVFLIEPTVNAALRTKLLSAFCNSAYTWRQYANSFDQKTQSWAPNSGGKLPNCSGQRPS